MNDELKQEFAELNERVDKLTKVVEDKLVKETEKLEVLRRMFNDQEKTVAEDCYNLARLHEAAKRIDNLSSDTPDLELLFGEQIESERK